MFDGDVNAQTYCNSSTTRFDNCCSIYDQSFKDIYSMDDLICTIEDGDGKPSWGRFNNGMCTGNPYDLAKCKQEGDNTCTSTNQCCSPFNCVNGTCQRPERLQKQNVLCLGSKCDPNNSDADCCPGAYCKGVSQKCELL